MFGPPVQLAYVVDDPAVAARRWEAEFGAGPFVVRDHIVVTDVVVHGQVGTFDHSSAYGWWGTTMIELFCQHDDAPGVVAEWRSRHAPVGEGGLHHVACFVDDLDHAVEQAESVGLTTAMTARAGDVRFAFIDDLDRAGHYWELYEPTTPLVAFYEMVENRHVARRLP